VSFSYPGQEGGLQDVTLRIEKGTRVAVVGPSGAGKSTLLHLLARFYDPTSGTISFDGQALRGVSLASLRRQLGIVFQESVLFDDTIRENIRLGMLSAGDEEVARASRRAGVDGFAQLLADGLQTTVGERGSRLSGGQRQRVGIARAILREPALLLLDEPTSALDPVTEAGVWATLDEVGAGCTVVTVTHRLAPVARADHIVVLYPLWLGTLPAMLKGLLEQVMRPGFGFEKQGGGRRPKRLLKGRSARLVVTKGMPELFDEVDRSEHSIRSLASDILGLCGIGPVRTTVLEGADTMKDVERDKARYDMRRLGARAR